MITSGLNNKLHSISKFYISQVIIPQVMVVVFFFLFIFHRHSTQEPASSRVTYFILLVYEGTNKSGEVLEEMQVNGLEGQKKARKKSLAVNIACMAIH